MTKEYQEPFEPYDKEYMMMDADRKRAHAGRMMEHLATAKEGKGLEHRMEMESIHYADARHIAPYFSLATALAARQEEWDPSDKLSLTFFATEMAGECGEACNVVKKLERERLGLPGSRDTISHLGEELADLVITAYNLAWRAGVDLNSAIETKFNATSEEMGFKTRLEMK